MIFESSLYEYDEAKKNFLLLTEDWHNAKNAGSSIHASYAVIGAGLELEKCVRALENMEQCIISDRNVRLKIVLQHKVRKAELELFVQALDHLADAPLQDLEYLQ